MLRTCLDSLAAQILPYGISPQIIVADNEAAPNNRGSVEAFAATCPFPVHYVHQPKRGIAAARNAILDSAMAIGADWIAMLDDDEIADERWIANLMIEQYRHVPVLGGHRLWIYPEPRPFWAPENQLKTFVEGGASTRIGTGNVRFSIALPRAGMRFDETLGLSGGEDFAFFSAAHRAGFEIRRTNHAVTHETIHRSRMNFRFMVYRHYAHIAWEANGVRREKGLGRVILKLPKLALYVPLGTLEMLVSPLAYAFGRRRFKQFALRGGKRLASAGGVIAALFSHLPQPYRVTHGS